MNKAQKLAVEKFPHNKFPGEMGDSLRFAFVVGYIAALGAVADVLTERAGQETQELIVKE